MQYLSLLILNDLTSALWLERPSANPILRLRSSYCATKIMLIFKICMSLKLFFPDAATRKNDFAIGEIFEKEWGQRKKGIMHTNCSLPESNKMFCVLEERERGWNLTEEFDFSKVHMRVVCTHLHLLTPACLHLFSFSLHLLFFSLYLLFFSLHLLCFQFA